MIAASRAHRLAFPLVCLPLLLLLAGCPGDAPTSANGTVPATATAPTISQTTQTTTAAGPGKPRAEGQAARPGSVPASAVSTPAQASGQSPVQSAREQQLIKQAETSYQSGVNNYRANRLDAARLDFDYAVDSMLSSGLPLTGDTPLAEEFDRLVNAINSLEMAALKQGNGFSPKVEDAPLEAANDITFPANPELVARLKTELNITSDLPLVINDQVAGYIGVFSNSTVFRNHMAASLRRAGRYREMMQKILAQEGVPQDLIYLSVAESGFQPQALNSRSGAGGMWQFMPANDYLKRNGYFDERFDPEKSTRAYARYIRALYNEFGDWYLAMAAYDWGPGRITTAVQRTGYADFWELYRRNAMPAETRAYVPQILAAIIMAKNPERYGLDKVTLDPPVLYDTVSTDYAIDLRLVADVTQSSVADIVALNPALLRLTTPRDMSFELHIPPGTKQLFADRLKDIPADHRASWRFHIVKQGETLESIASSLHARASEIAETNNITLADPMSVDDELVVPVVSVATERNPSRYTARRGDTLVTIADRFNVSLEDLRRWNALSTSSIRPGRTIFVAEPVRLAPSIRGRSRGRVSTRHPFARGSASRTFGRSSRRVLHGTLHGSSHSTFRALHAPAGRPKHRAGR